MITKITIVGDIMCEPLLLKAAKNGKAYNFHRAFENIRGFLKESDIVIGNLETPLAGEKAGYTKGLFSFNAPDSFVDAVVNTGINFILTANNHCLDRGIDGLVRTVRTLKKKGIPYAGTFAPDEERKEATYIDINGIKIAVVSYTYGTNYFNNHIILNGEQKKLVNLLRPQNELYYMPGKAVNVPMYKKAINKVLKRIPEEQRFYVKNFLGITVNVAHADDSFNRETTDLFLLQMKDDIAKARMKADFVIFCPHVGGQFNSEPGAFSKYVFQAAADCGCDIIVASHAHVVLKAEMKNNVPCFYSLGNFAMSPNSVYLLHDNLPDYGIATHFYIEEMEIKKVSFSILKIVEDRKECLTVYPLKHYMEMISDTKKITQIISEAEKIYTIVTGKKMSPFIIQNEYDFWCLS